MGRAHQLFPPVPCGSGACGGDDRARPSRPQLRPRLVSPKSCVHRAHTCAADQRHTSPEGRTRSLWSLRVLSGLTLGIGRGVGGGYTSSGRQPEHSLHRPAQGDEPPVVEGTSRDTPVLGSPPWAPSLAREHGERPPSRKEPACPDGGRPVCSLVLFTRKGGLSPRYRSPRRRWSRYRGRSASLADSPNRQTRRS